MNVRRPRIPRGSSVRALTTSEFNAAVWRSMTEKTCQQRIIDHALYAGFERELIYHTWMSKRSQPGFPDLVMIKPPRVVVVEVKREGKAPTPAQWVWLRAFAANPMIEVYWWQPHDLDLAREILATGPHVSRIRAVA